MPLFPQYATRSTSYAIAGDVCDVLEKLLEARAKYEAAQDSGSVDDMASASQLFSEAAADVFELEQWCEHLASLFDEPASIRDYDREQRREEVAR